MYFLLSPAKSLNETDTVPNHAKELATQPQLIYHAQALMAVLKTKEPTDLQELMSISNDLAQLNAQRNQDWVWDTNKPFSIDDAANPAKPAGYLFNGGVYSGLDIYNMDKDSTAYLNERLGILSGLYGLLKPLDLIQPYRLEMGTKLENERGAHLYDFWDTHITEVINERLKAIKPANAEKVIINLASNEYFKAVKKKSVDVPIITPRFEDEKNGSYKVISFYAKTARGLMMKYAAENKITKVDDLKGFDLEGYYYVDEESDDKTLIFRRNADSQV